MIHGRERLARADAAVVRRDHAVKQDAESRFAEKVRAEHGQQTVLEHASGQGAAKT